LKIMIFLFANLFICAFLGRLMNTKDVASFVACVLIKF